MIHTVPQRPDDADWQVPSHETALYAPRRHAHALVIPVINEGERIRGQLQRIQAADLPVDVIIADGGSIDGSLDPAFVAGVGVRAVLTKTGPGKLSAQLRMAYAFALREGYAGIVTIDGNGKDGVEAVRSMVDRLEAGADYVQGSRYLPGGMAENTPLERTIANRLIHAPLLSLAGRHWFTDTTNGFRAYSARFLTHPEVRPFREEFAVYSLLFYLTVRAGQLGLRVEHVPVERRYPDDGKVPTKIGGFASKLALLGETVFAATGGHTPVDAPLRRPGLHWAVLAALLIVLPLFLGLVAAPRYSPDSWALYELSRTVFGGDFYRFTHFRSYASVSDYSSAFPPLTPVLIAGLDALTGSGARSGLYLAFAAFLAFAGASEWIGRRVTGAAWVGLAAALVVLTGPKMLVDELAAGRTIPLQLALYAAVLIGLVAPERITAARAAAIGLVAGLAILNRFDALLLPLLAAGAIGWLTRRAEPVAAALAASALAVSPWIAFSLAAHGTLFATDNAGTALSLDPAAFVTDWWPVAPPTLADDPAAWARRLAGSLGRYLHTIASLAASPLGVVLLGVLGLWGALHGLAARRPGAVRTGLPLAALRLLALFAGAMAVLTLPQILTGYNEPRYFTALAWAGALAALCSAVACGATPHQRAVYARLLFLGIAAPVLAASLWQLAGAVRAGETGADAAARFDAPADVAALRRCLGKERAEARVLVLGDDAFAARAGALGGIAAMMEPRNMAQGRLDAAGARAFLRHWQVDHVLVMDPSRRAFSEANLAGPAVPRCPLALFAARKPL
jgi:hypothetical protein